MNVASWKPPLSRRPASRRSRRLVTQKTGGIAASTGTTRAGRTTTEDSATILLQEWSELTMFAGLPGKWEWSTSLENGCRKNRETGGSFRVVGRWHQG